MAFCAAVEAQLEQSMSAALGTSGQGPMGKAEPAGVGNRQLLRTSVGSRACQEVNEICCNLSKKIQLPVISLQQLQTEVGSEISLERNGN